MNYPDRHHPVYFLIDALTAAGANAEFARDERTLGCWGAVVNGEVMVWLIDNRHAHERVTEDPAAAELLKRGALVCCAQKPDAERVGGRWLPLAVTPGYREPEKPQDRHWNVAFVGYVRDSGREQILRHVARHYSLCTHQGVFGDAAVSTYWQAKIGLNVPTNYGALDAYDSANMRCFEILATGTTLVTSQEDYLADLGLESGVNCLTYFDADNLVKVIGVGLEDWYFKSQSIGANGAKLARERHTYAHRAAQVLEWLK